MSELDQETIQDGDQGNAPQGGDAKNEESHEDAPRGTIPIADIEAAASQQGWSPDKGDLSALEFLGNGRVFRDRLFDEVKELREENAKVYGLVTENMSRQETKTYANETEAWEAKFDEAVEAGDKDEVKRLRNNMPQQPVQQTDPNVEFINSWMSENKWFDDPEMKADAMGFYESEKIKAGRDDPKSILPKVLDRIKKVHPSKFEAPKNNNQNRGAGAESGGRQTKGKGGGLQRSDLTEAEGAHFDAFVKSGLKPEKLLASIQAQRSTRS